MVCHPRQSDQSRSPLAHGPRTVCFTLPAIHACRGAMWPQCEPNDSLFPYTPDTCPYSRRVPCQNTPKHGGEHIVMPQNVAAEAPKPRTHGRTFQQTVGNHRNEHLESLQWQTTRTQCTSRSNRRGAGGELRDRSEPVHGLDCLKSTLDWNWVRKEDVTHRTQSC